jgi:2-C-methyl-D-erythritol 4-phosphate cytidylyltransferase
VNEVNIGVVIAAAGQGKRMGGPVKKQFIELAGKPVLLHTLDLFVGLEYVKEIVVVTAEEDIERTRKLLAAYPQALVIPGGAERQDSVYLGITALSSSDYVMIHDGARPFLSCSTLEKLVDAVRVKRAAILAVPVKDTIKRTDETGVVMDTPPRKSLWAVQTPQAFALSDILAAHEQARKDGFLGTDDASLVERIGRAVHVVEGEYTNIKLTTPEDIVFGEAILKWRREREQ